MSLLTDQPFSHYLARRFHEVYEAAAPHYGYETRSASAVPWESVPEPNRQLMIYVCDAIADELIEHVRSAVKHDMNQQVSGET